MFELKGDYLVVASDNATIKEYLWTPERTNYGHNKLDESITEEMLKCIVEIFEHNDNKEGLVEMIKEHVDVSEFVSIEELEGLAQVEDMVLIELDEYNALKGNDV